MGIFPSNSISANTITPSHHIDDVLIDPWTSFGPNFVVGIKWSVPKESYCVQYVEQNC